MDEAEQGQVHLSRLHYGMLSTVCSRFGLGLMNNLRRSSCFFTSDKFDPGCIIALLV